MALIPKVTLGQKSVQVLLTDLTLESKHQDSVIVCVNSIADATITIPPDSTYDFPVGTQIWISKTTAYNVTITPGGGVTLGSVE